MFEGNSSSGVVLQEFVYHPTEERVLVKKVYEDGDLVETVIYPNENLVRSITYPNAAAINATDTVYVKDGSGLVAAYNYSDEKTFYLNDHLGSASVLTNDSGEVLEETFYEPHGGIISGGKLSRFDYEGKEYTTETGQYDFNFRGYNPELKIFTKPDTQIQDFYNPQSLNRYMFERGNPYNSIDPTGHLPGQWQRIKDSFKWDFQGTMKKIGDTIDKVKTTVSAAWKSTPGSAEAEFVYDVSPVKDAVTILDWYVAEGMGADGMFMTEDQLNSKRKDAFWSTVSLGATAAGSVPAKYTGKAVSYLSTAATVYTVGTGGNNLFRDTYSGLSSLVSNPGFYGFSLGMSFITGYVTASGSFYSTSNPYWAPEGSTPAMDPDNPDATHDTGGTLGTIGGGTAFGGTYGCSGTGC